MKIIPYRRNRISLLALAGLALVSGCAGLPRIDPSGERILIWPDPSAQTTSPIAPPTIGNVPAAPVYSGNRGPCLGICGSCRDACDWITGRDYVSPAPPAAQAGPPVAFASARPGIADAKEVLSITPEKILAPVGSEVVLKAGVCADAGYLRTNRRVEWMLEQRGTGQFVTVGEQGELDILRLPWQRPNKHDNTFAVGYTSPFHTCLNRGTADLSDDVQIRPGDAWITVTSPSEGASYVTAVAPESKHWEARRATATIYWVDAQWELPPSTTVQLGQAHTLTTTVRRQTDGAPVAGWIVRYEVVDGPTARLGYEAGRVSQATTDASGKASIQVTPTDDQPGTAVVNVKVIRPAQSGNMPSPELELGGGDTVITWSPTGSFSTIEPSPTLPNESRPIPPEPFEPRPTNDGPSIGSERPGQPQLEVTARRDNVGPIAVGDLIPITITVVNNGDAPARNIVVSDRYDRGLSNVLDTAGDFEIRYDGMPDLAPGESDSVRVEFRAEDQGRQCHTVSVLADGAERVVDRQCFDVAPPPAPPAPRLEVAADGELQREVGETYTFRSRVTNVGNVLAKDLQISILHDPELEPIQAEVGFSRLQNGFEWTESSLSPSASIPFVVQYRCLTPNAQSRISIFVRADGSEELVETKTVEIVPARGAGGPITPDPQSTSPLVGSLTSSPDPQVGQPASFEVTVSNTGTTPLRDVEFRLVFPSNITPRLTSGQSLYPFRVNQNTYEFSSVTELRPGSPIRLVVPYDPIAEGRQGVRLEMRSPDVPEAQSVEIPLTIRPR